MDKKDLEIQKLHEEILELKAQVNRLTAQPKYKQVDYKYVNEDKLSPPPYQPSNHEIELAKARYAIEDEIWEIVHSLSLYISFLKGEELKYPYTKEILTKNANRALETWNTAMDNWKDGVDLWNVLIDTEWFKEVYIDSLDSLHCGDCTAFPASCSRCHAEGMFKIPYTANWSKSEGSKLFSEYRKDWERKKEK